MNPKLAVAQMRSTDDIDGNFRVVERLCKQAHKEGAAIVSFPENFAFLARKPEQTRTVAEPLDGPLFTRYRALASSLSLEVSFGGFPERGTKGQLFNTHVIVDKTGAITATYRKIHLFVVAINASTTFNEAAHFVPGREIVTAASTVGTLGLSICYDLRFAELYAALSRKGAEILLVPSAFTAETGKAHWEILLRARAIENQCYVAAAAQFGDHYPGRSTHGHAMIVDPWGVVVAECLDDEGLALAPIDTNYLKRLRESMPMASHRRPELFV